MKRIKVKSVASVIATVVLVGVIGGVVYTTRQALKNRPPEVTVTNVKVIHQTEEQRRQRYKEMFADYENLNPVIIRELGDDSEKIEIGHSYLKNTIRILGAKVLEGDPVSSDNKKEFWDINNPDVKLTVMIRNNTFDIDKFSVENKTEEYQSENITLEDGSIVYKDSSLYGRQVRFSGSLKDPDVSYWDYVDKKGSEHQLNLTGSADLVMEMLKDEIMKAKQEEIIIGMSCNEFEMKEILNNYLCLYSDPTHKLDVVKISKYDENIFYDILKDEKDGKAFRVWTGWCMMRVNVQKMQDLIRESERNEEKLKVIAELWSASLNKDLEGTELLEELQKNMWRLGYIVEAIGDRSSWDEDKNASRKIEGALGRVRDTTSPTRYMEDGLGVCVAKAELMEWVLDYMNIHSVTVSGICVEPHMWVALGVGNQWFHYDINTDYYTKDSKTGERIYMGTSDITEIENMDDLIDIVFRLHNMEEYRRLTYAAFNEVN